MKVVILAGGRGSRLAELTEVVPKPMVRIGERPMLWHIMKHFARFGHTEFVIALGYKGYVIKEFFLNYRLLSASLTVDLATGATSEYDGASAVTDDWRVHLVETGLETGTGARLRRLARHLQGEPFLLTYGDGVSDVNLDRLLESHRRSGCLATITAVRPPSRFGGLVFDEERVREFIEKPQIGEGWINGGFMVLEPGVFAYTDDATDSLERDVLERIALDGGLGAHRHEGFWQCMDTLRERDHLEDLWRSGRAAWKTWA
jgi:glucose-1-phosphate cytidylyltransferase